MIIINADDFGCDAEVNDAVLQCFRDGLCSSTTLMANMPAFEEACDLVHQEKLGNHVGLHLVLRDGFPLTEPLKKVPAFCDSTGRLSVLRVRPVLSLSGEEKRALAGEIRAQISRCRRLGVPLTHVDSHYHMHTNFTIASVLVDVMREQGLSHLRISRNCGPGIPKAKSLYKGAFNRWLGWKKVAATRYFGSITDFLYLTERNSHAISQNDAIEIAIHPMLNEGSEVVDRDTQCGVVEAVKKIAEYRQAVSFAGYRYG